VNAPLPTTPGPSSTGPAVLATLRDVLLPLVLADGGELWLVATDDGGLHLHLAGACSGCPGFAFTRDHVIVPAIRAVSPELRVTITGGYNVPARSTRVA
jgi:Fe-S cluster biogenesis protein NfuA